MRFLERRLSRFAAQHPRFGIPDLMRYVVIGQAIVYALFLFTGRNLQLLSFLDFTLEGLRHGEVWRLVTFVFQPNSYAPLSFVILLSFYYFVGTTLERTWGTCRFTLYYLSGMLLSVLATAITALCKGHGALSLGNILGANLFNLVLVSGAAAAISPFPLPESRTLAGLNGTLVLDLPLMLLAMALLMVPVLLRGRTYRWQGAALLALYAFFCGMQFV